MLELNDITIDKKDYINSFLHRRCSKNSEFSFTNLFMWRKGYDMKYTVIDDMLCIMPKHGNGPRSATFPIGYRDENGNERDITHVIGELVAYFEERGEIPLIRLYDEKAVEMLNNAFPDRFIITEDRGSFDYVYSVEELTRLAGKKFHAKKNHVNKFKRLYPDWEYVSLTPNNAEECMALFDSWRDNKETEPEGLSEEREAIWELLHNWESLNITGGGLRVNGELIAFSFGEPLCGKTAVIHLEHANTDYEGAFAMMNQQFLENEWQDFTYVNREEDMGLPGMRKAKESYRPVMMVKKYVASII